MPELPNLAAFDPASAMTQLAGSDPRLALMMQMMQPRPSRDVADDQAALVAELTERLAAAEALAARLRRSGRLLLARARADEERLADLAAALGACGSCWGEDGGCPSCRGRGRPGMMRPDPELRARLLGPPCAPAPPAPVAAE